MILTDTEDSDYDNYFTKYSFLSMRNYTLDSSDLPPNITLASHTTGIMCSSIGSYVAPTINNNLDLGLSYYKWKDIYASNTVIQTSDRNEKDSIIDLSIEKAMDLISNLKPSTYMMKSGTSGRIHWGMIAQDIEELLDRLGWSSLDFAGFIKSPKMHIEEEIFDETGKIIKKRVEEPIEGEYEYSLRYNEFIAPIVRVEQYLLEENKKKDEKISNLEERISVLEELVNQLLNKEV